MKSGGLLKAKEIIKIAEQSKIPCMVGCMCESNIGITAAVEGKDARSAETIRGFIRTPQAEVQAPQLQEAPDQTGTAAISPAPAAAPTSIGRFQIRVLN